VHFPLVCRIQQIQTRLRCNTIRFGELPPTPTTKMLRVVRVSAVSFRGPFLDSAFIFDAPRPQRHAVSLVPANGIAVGACVRRRYVTSGVRGVTHTVVNCYLRQILAKDVRKSFIPSPGNRFRASRRFARFPLRLPTTQAFAHCDYSRPGACTAAAEVILLTSFGGVRACQRASALARRSQ
jgi:hypothetical protein